MKGLKNYLSDDRFTLVEELLKKKMYSKETYDILLEKYNSSGLKYLEDVSKFVYEDVSKFVYAERFYTKNFAKLKLLDVLGISEYNVLCMLYKGCPEEGYIRLVLDINNMHYSDLLKPDVDEDLLMLILDDSVRIIDSILDKIKFSVHKYVGCLEYGFEIESDKRVSVRNYDFSLGMFREEFPFLRIEKTEEGYSFFSDLIEWGSEIVSVKDMGLAPHITRKLWVYKVYTSLDILNMSIAQLESIPALGNKSISGILFKLIDIVLGSSLDRSLIFDLFGKSKEEWSVDENSLLVKFNKFRIKDIPINDILSVDKKYIVWLYSIVMKNKSRDLNSLKEGNVYLLLSDDIGITYNSNKMNVYFSKEDVEKAFNKGNKVAVLKLENIFSYEEFENMK